MGDSTSWSIENMCHSDAPEEYKQEALRWTRQKVSNQLFDILWQNKLPAVVDIDEKIDYSYHNDFMCVPNDRIRIKVTITPVQYRNVEMISTYYGGADWIKFNEHKNLFMRFWRKIIESYKEIKNRSEQC
jgi:hypothetical protein